ncbi:hypothetical protein EJD97_025413, partial [Solanum chilense]
MDAQSPSKRFIRGSLSKSTNMQDISSKFNNDPISFVDGGLKNTFDVVTGSNKKRKHKTDVHTFHNDKNKVVGSGSIEHK